MTLPRTVLAEQIALGRAGRLAPPKNWTPASGTAALVLGSDIPGVFVKADVGDAIEAKTFGDFTNGGTTAYVRFTMHVRPPASAMPVGVYWKMTATLVDGANAGSPTPPRCELDLRDANNREASHFDFAIPVLGTSSIVSSLNQLALRLELAGTPGEYEVELPGLYFDSVIMDPQASRPTPINRVPDNGDVKVPINASIFLEINDPSVARDLIVGSISHTKVYVNGVLAYDQDGGGFQTGFTGPDSTVVLFSNAIDGRRTLRLNIDPTTNFTNSSTVTVRVVATAYAFSGSPPEYNYSFTTEDLTAPTIASATAIDRKTVRVVFSEPVVGADATASNDATNPANWTIFVASTSLETGLPAVTSAVVSVSKVDDLTFDVETATELTRNALYRIEGGPVEDLVSNQMVAPNNTAFFVGFECVGPDGRDFTLLDLLPDMNQNEDESDDLKKFVACLQEVTDLLLCDIDHWVDILDPDIAPERYIDAMLADLGNPFNFDLSDVDKRRLIRVLVPIYQQKGTDPGIINAIRFFVGVEVTISVPAFDGVWDLGVSELGAGTWLSTSDIGSRLGFYVVSPVVLSDAQREQITTIVKYMKDARTHFLGIQEPVLPDVPDHWELGLSELGTESLLH
jgi:phage tail-like protein